jgi:hypothetical protein
MLRTFWLWLTETPATPHQWTAWTIVEGEHAQGFLALAAVTPLIQSRRCVVCGWTERASVFGHGPCYSAAERAKQRA